MPHSVFDEGIFAFVRPKKGAPLTAEEVMAHCKEIASYKRPQHVEIWASEREFPITRSTKVDKMALREIAQERIEALRREGKWDA
jgi:fatty-acyl-CoA synthase